MDVLRWKVSVRMMTGIEPRHRGPGVAITAELSCRVCEGKAVLWDAVQLHPSNLKPGSSRIGHPNGGEAWNQWIISRRLADARYCPSCGTASIIPSKQRDALIAATDGAVTQAWLQEVEEAMGLQEHQYLVSGGRRPEEYKYDPYYSASDAAPREISQEWHDFDLATV